MSRTFSFSGVTLEWLNHHAAFRITSADKVVYIDPWDISASNDADIILITHPHYDHCSPSDVEKLSKGNTVVLAPTECAAKLKNAKAIVPGQKMAFGDITIEAVPAYNVKPERQNYHKKQDNWVGYVVEIAGKRIYHAGDTDKIPEMSSLRGIDLALLPCGGTYTMTGAEAGEAANAINPEIAIPMHCGRIVGTARDIDDFRKTARMRVEVLE